MCTAYEIGKRAGKFPARVKTAAVKELMASSQTALIRPTIPAPVVIHAKTVNVGKSGKSPNIQPPTGAIASSLAHRNYAKHLVDRYHEFASDQPGRTFSYPAIYANIKKMFGAKWDLIPIESFLKLTNYLQGRIDNTRLGRINRSKGHPNYSTFEEFKTKHGYE